MADPQFPFAVPATAALTQGPCPSCGAELEADAVACPFCNQVRGLPSGVRLASPGKRLGAHLLDMLLSLVTLYIGWLIWSLIVWKDGLTPGKQLLGLRVVSIQRGRPANWATMFARELVGKLLGALAITLTLGVLAFMLVWDKRRQEMWDKIVETVVVDDPHKQLAAAS